MPESIDAWWMRRQRSKERWVPYPVGAFRDDWQRYPVLIRQFHPDLNRNITLTQIPPAADVYLTWQCDSGHVFVATPDEQRNRPGRTRRRSSWCPECSQLAAPRRVQVAPPRPLMPGSAHPEPSSLPATVPQAARTTGSGRAPLQLKSRTTTGTAQNAPNSLRPGEAFYSERAPKPASAAEGELRSRLAARFDPVVGLGFARPQAPNAVRVKRPFFERLEVWPDIVLPELRVALEYDTIGRFGLEHVGAREDSDRRKDRLLRAVGWEVVRVRCGKLLPLGPHDVVASGVTTAVIDQLIEALSSIRGDLLVSAYLARPAR